MNPFWTSISGSEIQQGDFLPNCFVPVAPDDFSAAKRNAPLDVKNLDIIVISQSCDLANQKSGQVAICPVYSIPFFESTNLGFKKKGVWEEVRKGRREGLHLLASPTMPEEPRESLLVNFREIFSLPIGYLQTQALELGDRWRLQSPFLEHFSQTFARFFMRVGLPTAVPPFPN